MRNDLRILIELTLLEESIFKFGDLTKPAPKKATEKIIITKTKVKIAKGI